jgi:hypothetical protein
MRPARLSELRQLIAQPEFQQWWTALERSRTELATASREYEELLSQTHLLGFRAELTQKNAIDTLYRAGECEDAAANRRVEATELENRSFQAVAAFEEHRILASEAWYRMGAAEKELEDRKEAAKASPGRKADAELRTAERTEREARAHYSRAEEHKGKLWAEVERLWGQSARASLAVAEDRVRGKKTRQEAEQLFALAEERKGRAQALRGEAEATALRKERAEAEILTLLDQAQERFGCAPGKEFLYFRLRDDGQHAFAVALVHDAEAYNLEVRPLSIYLVEHKRGVAFLEPARSDAPLPQEADRRFEEYFLRGRRGEVKSRGA